MGKKTIFFDLDDTLYDRSVPYCSAFAAFFGGKYADKAQTAFERTMLRGYEVFEAAHTGQMTMEAMHIYRHQTGLRDAGIEITPEQALRMQALYAEEQRHISLTPVMEEILTFCRAHFAAMGVITNGGVQSQRDKLKSLGAARWFRPELVLISDADRRDEARSGDLPHSGAGRGRTGGVASMWAIRILRMSRARAAAAGEASWLNRRGDAAGELAPTYCVKTEEDLLACLKRMA